MAEAPHQAELAELRTLVARSRREAQNVADAANRARAALQSQRESIRAAREQAERDLRTAARYGQLGHEERALVQRLERGETSWRAIMTGTDEHWSATTFREGVSESLERLIEDLRESDPEFRAEHDEALRAAGTTGTTGASGATGAPDATGQDGR